MNQPIFEITEQDNNKSYSKFVISPLEQGYGHTLGNSLRRVLLKSLGGAAITSVRISQVKHQFSTLKGMKEDVVEFLLNLKKVRFSYDGEKPVTVKLSAKGPGEVKAKDIQVPANLKIANPEAVLAFLNKGAKLDAQMEVTVGEGYLSADDREEKSIGLIPLDAIFSPVTKVNYKIEETRVGRFTNYDKLILEIWTDGTIKPKDALVKSADILISYFKQILSPKKVEKQEVKIVDILGPTGKLSVEEIGLPTRVANALIKAGYETVEDLVKVKREDLVKVRNLGEKSIKIVAAALADKNINFS
ncbi:MAG TPA: DNA-directed RNA polymerase subunit alpha [Patescibacteria group bacterium]|nr:DNA-directed RNA polymerase subunit alpha [Patescibacteria group bacterium]